MVYGVRVSAHRIHSDPDLCSLGFGLDLGLINFQVCRARVRVWVKKFMDPIEYNTEYFKSHDRFEKLSIYTTEISWTRWTLMR